MGNLLLFEFVEKNWSHLEGGGLQENPDKKMSEYSHWSNWLQCLHTKWRHRVSHFASNEKFEIDKFHTENNFYPITEITLDMQVPFHVDVSRKTYIFTITVIDPYDMNFDVYLFLATETAIAWNKSRDLFHPITVVITKNK